MIRRLAEWDPPELRARRADVLEAMEEYAAAVRCRKLLDDVGNDLAEWTHAVLLDELREDADVEVELARDRVAEVSVSWDCSRTSWEAAEGADLSEDLNYDDVNEARKRRQARRAKLALQLAEIFKDVDDNE